jgi:hypothetical protein
MANTPTNNSETSTLDQILASLPKPRFGNGFATGTVSHNETLESYEDSPEIFLNVPKEDEEEWDINIVDDSGEDIVPVISCYGTRQLFSIGEFVYCHDDDSDPGECLENVVRQEVATSLAISFSPAAPPTDGSPAFIEVQYKGLTARVEWEWSDIDKSGDIIVTDFEGNKLCVSYEGRGISYKEA